MTYLNNKTMHIDVKETIWHRLVIDESYEAEGLVLKNPYGMLLRSGDRLITKLKTTDFRKWEAANVRKA